MKLGFDEVNKGYSESEALEEAKRCLNCKKPRCVTGCPASLPIPQFIAQLKDGNIDAAYDLILTKSNLSQICSRVCAHEKQCEGHCILNAKKAPIKVGSLERYIGDHSSVRYQKPEKFIDYRVAIIGAGPAGLSCALELAKNNIKSTIFEKESYIGGVMAYGIPEYRLPKSILENYYNILTAMGVEFKFSQDMSTTNLEELKKQGFNKIFVSTGLIGSKKLGINNEEAIGIVDANKLLKEVNLFVSYNKGSEIKLKGKTVVVGAGNVAMDAARVAKRISDDDVIIVYRRALEQAPASKVEINEALEEGVLFKFLTNPVDIITNDKNEITAVKCEIMQLVEEEGCDRPLPVGTNVFEVIECSNLIVAIGQSPVKDLTKTNNILTNQAGYICVSDDMTSNQDVYAGGDIVRGADTVVRSMVDGKRVAQKIIDEINGVNED